MSSKSNSYKAKIELARKINATDPGLEKGFNNLVRVQGDYLQRKNKREEKKAKENAEQSKKKSGFLSRLFSRKSSKGGKKNRQTKRKNKKC